MLPAHRIWRAATPAVFFLAATLGHAAPDTAACEVCHGKGGNSVIPGTPSIAGQPKTFLVNQLVFFREELRASPIMQPVAKGMSDRDAIAYADHFSKSAARVVDTAATDARLQKRGRELAGAMLCGQCHLPTFRGREQMPRLAGQREDYLHEAMRAYRDNRRTGADTTMAGVLHGVGDDDIRALSHFLARLK